MGGCSIPGCRKTAHCRGWCPAHYSQWRRVGDPLGSKKRTWLPKGEQNPAHKLTESDIPIIFKLHYEGYSNPAIGQMFNCTRANIRRIVKRETWRHIEV